MNSIRVLVVDDHAVVRQGLRSLLSNAEGVEVIGEAPEGEEALEAADRLAPDVVLMDFVIPRTGGNGSIDTLLDRRPDVKVVAWGGYDERIMGALRDGVLGYVSRTASRDDFVHAIRNIAAAPASGSRKAGAAPRSRRMLRSARDVLTTREIEILRHVAAGCSNDGIGRRLGISVTTVRTHISSILSKLGVHNRVEATLCALRDRLTTLEECLATSHVPPR